MTAQNSTEPMKTFEKVEQVTEEGEPTGSTILADTRGMEPKPTPEPEPVPTLEPQPTPEPVPQLTTPPPEISAAHAAIQEAAAAEKGEAPKGPTLDIAGYSYQCRPRPPGHVSATIARLTGTIASAQIGSTSQSQIREKALKDPAFLMELSRATGSMWETAISLVIKDHQPALTRRWTGDCPDAEIITDGDLLPAIMEVMARYARQTAPLPSPSTPT